MKIKIVKDQGEGSKLAKQILYETCDKNTALFLSGGKTPRPLYKQLAKEKKLKVGAVAMVDDRYSLHEQYSNEFMIKDSGLIKFLESRNIAFYSILKFGLNRVQTAREYESDVRFLFEQYKKKIAILGIGSDGHIASITSTLNDLNHLSDQLVIDIRNFPAEIRERITLTLSAISKMDLIIVLSFGIEKREGIKTAIKVFFNGEISRKTILITDQKI